MSDLKVGYRVRVNDQLTTFSDIDSNTMRPYRGAIGFIAAKKIGELGSSEEDPLWVVQFEAGKREVFWTEELTRNSASTSTSTPTGTTVRARTASTAKGR